MPGGDRTGPMGIGPMSGRRAGFCAGYAIPGYLNSDSEFGGMPVGRRGIGYGRGFGRGYGRGQGFGRGFGQRGIAASYGYGAAYGNSYYKDRVVSAQDEAKVLKEQVKMMQEEVNAISQRIKYLESEPESGENKQG